MITAIRYPCLSVNTRLESFRVSQRDKGVKTAEPTDFTSVDFPAPRNPEMIVIGTLLSLSSKVLKWGQAALSTWAGVYARDIFVVVHEGSLVQ